MDPLTEVKRLLPTLISRLTNPIKHKQEIVELDTFFTFWQQHKNSLIKDMKCNKLLINLSMKLLDSFKFVTEEDYMRGIGLLLSLSQELNFMLSEDQMMSLLDSLPKPITGISFA